MKLQKLPPRFYLRPALAVARDLPGLFLCRKSRGVILIGRIVEVEAYLGETDPASHAFRGETPRNEVMFRRGGFLYVYFTYGMHHCANVVTGEAGVANAVLIRGLEPVRGIERMARHRFGTERREVSTLPAASLRNLTNGPAKLCQAMGIGKRESGSDLCGEGVWLARGPRRKEVLLRSTRIGLTKGTESRWRFYLKGSQFVSPGKPS